MTMPKVSMVQKDLEFAANFASVEKYRLVTFSDGASSAEHLLRVTELENEQRRLECQIATLPK